MTMFSHFRNKHDSDIETWFIKYGKAMYYAAYRILKNQAEAEDAVQDVFIRLLKRFPTSLDNITDERDLRNYLMKSSQNSALNLLKKRSNGTFIEYDEALQGESAEVIDVAEQVNAKTELQHILRVINRMSATYRDVLYFHYVLEFSIPEIAENFGISNNTAKKKLNRGRKILTEELRKEGIDLE